MGSASIPSADFAVELIPGIAKQAISAAGAKAEGGLVMAPVESLRVIEGFNVRVTGTKDYESGIADLTHSILREGFYKDKPLVGYVGKDGEADVIFLTDGYRRLEAVKRAIAAGAGDIERLPVILKPASTNMVDLTISLTKTGTPLAPYEMALVVKRLTNYNVTEDEIAKRLGITKRYVADLLVLTGAPAKVRQLVIDGKVAATLAIQMMREDPAVAAEKLAEAVKRAKAAGADRATAKHLQPMAAARGAGEDGEGDDAPARPAAHRNPKLGQPGKYKLTLKGKAGDEKTLKEIGPFAGIQGGAWYRPHASSGKKVVLTQPVNLKIAGVFGETLAELVDELDAEEETTGGETAAGPMAPEEAEGPRPNTEGL